MKKDKNIHDYSYGDSVEDFKLKSFVEHGTPADIDISAIKKKAFLKIHQQEQKQKRRRIMMYTVSVAASLLILIGINIAVTGGGWSGLDKGAESTTLVANAYDEEVLVPKGEKMTLMLADGTKIVANSRTVIRYPKVFDGKFREVYVRGEAYFDVAHDAKHPFVVNSDDFKVRVLGTEFNVSNYDAAHAKVVLVQGSVELRTAGSDCIRMKPSELVSLQHGEFAEKCEVNTEEYTCWMQGMINIEGEDMASVARKLSHYYGVTILFDEDIKTDKFYGRLVLNDDVNEVIEAIQIMTHTRMLTDGDTIRLMKE